METVLNVLQKNTILRKGNANVATAQTAIALHAKVHPITVLPAAISIFPPRENANFVWIYSKDAMNVQQNPNVFLVWKDIIWIYQVNAAINVLSNLTIAQLVGLLLVELACNTPT